MKTERNVNTKQASLSVDCQVNIKLLSYVIRKMSQQLDKISFIYLEGPFLRYRQRELLKKKKDFQIASKSTFDQPVFQVQELDAHPLFTSQHQYREAKAYIQLSDKNVLKMANYGAARLQLGRVKDRNAQNICKKWTARCQRSRP